MKPTADSLLLDRLRRLGAFVLPLAFALVLAPAVARAGDSDGDGWDDSIDTCSAVPSDYLADSDGDGFGDPCDCDFSGNGACNLEDFSYFLGDLVGGGDSGIGSDMNGDGSVNLSDFSLFIAGLLSGIPGPGAVGDPDPAAAFPGVTCDGPDDGDLCAIQLAPSITLEAIRSQLTIDGIDLDVSGDLMLPSPEGQVLLLNATLTIVSGDGPFGFETVRGSATLRNELEGELLFDVDMTGAQVDVGMDLGANIDADIPLADDLYYLFFIAQAGLLVDVGPFLIEGPGVSTTLIFNPGDPFFYAGAAIANIPIPTQAGVLILSAGGGIGFSEEGWIPYEPAVTEGIAALFPSFDGHMILQASGELPSCPGCPTLTFNGYAITDLDPQEDGSLALFGPDEDVALGINGDFGLEGNMGLLSLSVDLFSAAGGFESDDDGFSWFVGGRIGSDPDLFLLDVATEFDLLPPVAGELGLGVLVSDDPMESFFRFEGQGMVIGASGVEAATGVTVASFATADFFFQTGGAGTFLGGSTTVQDIVEGVRALEAQSWQLGFPSDTKPELVLYSRYEIGDYQLQESTIWISPLRIAQEGRLEMPNYTWLMYGEITRDGPLHRGTLILPIPYSYPEVEAMLQIADLISQQEEEVAQLQAAAGVAADAIGPLQQVLASAQSALNGAQGAFDIADDALQDNLDGIADARAIDCGCDECGINPVCYTICGTCEASKFATIEYLELFTSSLQTAYDIARTALLSAQGAVGAAQVRLAAAQQTLVIANLALDTALAQLSALYADRDNLPREDGVFDATVSLTLTAEDLTGSVGGDFQGVPVGTGLVYTDGTPRACFQPPVPGNTEEFCTPL